MKIIFITIFSLNFLLANISLSSQTSTIYNVTKKSAEISIGNLNIGQSGIILNKDDNKQIIISQAIVSKSDTTSSTITFLFTDILPQDSIPKSKLLPKNDDIFVLNHLYNSSLLIVPNRETKDSVVSLYNNQNFLSEDFFASYLKLEQQPVPTKKTFQHFCKYHQIGTIFIAVKNKLFIVDALSFKVIDTIILDIKSKKTKVPFLSKIDKIERGFWDFGVEKIKDYNRYYLTLLGIKK